MTTFDDFVQHVFKPQPTRRNKQRVASAIATTLAHALIENGEDVTFRDALQYAWDVYRQNSEDLRLLIYKDSLKKTSKAVVLTTWIGKDSKHVPNGCTKFLDVAQEVGSGDGSGLTFSLYNEQIVDIY